MSGAPKTVQGSNAISSGYHVCGITGMPFKSETCRLAFVLMRLSSKRKTLPNLCCMKTVTQRPCGASQVHQEIEIRTD